MRNFIRMFTFVKPYTHLYIPGVFMHNSQLFTYALIQALLISRITAAVLDNTARKIVYEIAILLGIFMVITFMIGLGVFLKYTAIAKITRDLKAILFKCFIKNSLEHSMSTHSGEGIAALNTDANIAAEAYDTAISELFSYFFSIIMGLVVVLAIDYRLGLASIAAGGLAFFVQSKFIAPLGRINKERLELNSNTVQCLSNILSGGLAVRVFNMQEKAHASFDIENRKMQLLSFKEAIITMWQILFQTVQGWLTLVIVFAFGGWLVAKGQIELPTLMMTPQMCLAVSNGIVGIAVAWAGLQAPAAAAERVFKILDAGQEDDDHVYVQPDENWCYDLIIKDLNFKYLNGEINALSDISLTIKENEMVAFVGESGSGKSTLLRAIIGMYHRININIQLGGININKSNPTAWRKQFAYVDQSCKLFDMTIAENIALGAGGDVSLETIKESAIRASADYFISSLPEGYDSFCGEKGASLSGGQKQRIAIARALCRRAPILVFDEVTSALDAESERIIMDTIESLRKDHTILITSHNINNIMCADNIVVMDNGCVAEMGSHLELMGKGGIYTKLLGK